MPISCGAFLVKNKDDFRFLEFHSDYLNRKEDEEEGYTNLVGKSLQTTRRFDALKVWFSFQVRGRKEWGEIIDSCIENAIYLYEVIESNANFETITKPEISSVVFRVIGSDELNKKIRKILIHEKGVVIGQTVFNSKVYLKCTLNPTLTKNDLESLLNTIIEIVNQENC